MDEIPAGLDPDELTMDLDDPEGSDLEDEDEDIIDDPSQSPFRLPSSGPGSTATSVTSSPPNNEDLPPSFGLTGKPLVGIKRGRGRPRREGGKPAQKRAPGAPRARKVRVGMPRGGGRGARHFRQFDRFDFDMSSCITPSPGDEIPMLDPETGALIFTDREKPFPPMEDLPYAPEQWPGKVCAFCNLGEKSQLGQGEMLRLNCPEGFTPQRVASDQNGNQSSSLPAERDNGDKSPRGPVTCRRQKSFNKCRHPSLTSEYVDELTIIGYNDQPEVNLLFESNGQFYVHRSCALWSKGVKKNVNATLENVGPVVVESSSRKCSFCNHFGASIGCKMDGCSKVYHYPCATASGAFQELPTLTVFCNSHVGQAALLCESSVCYTCKVLGDIANLMYCSSCGEHYHGICVGLAQHPGVRAGWQCRKCRICQVCRITGDESKIMTCEQCDKVYHAGCQRPIVTSIPKYGWKCRCCRVCGDCGSRTPGAGLSSRWHAHYTVCDSCYQQRNKGFSCPLCRRAYRAHAHREMVQCTMCRKFVHGTCDPDADLSTYHQRKEANPEYEYACTICKNLTQPGRTVAKRQSIEDPNELSASQESLYDDVSEFDSTYDEMRSMGLGKGKPYSASKIAKKRLGYATGMPGRPKGVGKGPPGFMKKARLTEFGRKRGPKAKMRGLFGVPGVGLQRPTADGRNDEEPGVENRLVLCSAKDKFVLTQDICVMCGALGTDQEGCLIACVQCGQCYHPYCVNVKVTKVILQKGWRCLDCTVCEGCGQRNDEGRLILCDDCDVSYHIYCMDPPLDYVPHGNWKCKWCAVCQTCGATDPGFNCTWMNSCTECGPCASHVNCPSCNEPYSEGELIIQCVQCERWLHGACDYIKTEEEAEKCAEEGYNCTLCRPRDIPPPHLAPSAIAIKPPTPTKSPTEMRSNNNYYVDGVCLSEFGHHHIKALSMEYHGGRRKGPKKKLPTVQDKEAGIMATIESVVAGGNADVYFTDNSLEDAKLELVDVKDEPQELYKEGMLWTKEDGPPPEGFTVFTMENGMSVLRRKRQRNLQKLGIGGFLVRMRGTRGGQENDDIDMLPGQQVDMPGPIGGGDDKPKRKPIRRKIKSKLAETFPAYLQEAFFGKDLMDVPDYKKEVESDESDEDRLDHFKSIQLSQDELKAVAAVTPKSDINDSKDFLGKINSKLSIPKEEDDTDDLKDMLALPSDLLDDNDLVNSIINEDDDDLAKTTESLDALADSNLTEDADNSKDTKDELSDILGPHFNLEAIPNINSKDVEDIFKGVLTDESQESQESNLFPIQSSNVFPPTPAPQAMPNPIPMIGGNIVRPNTLPNVNQGALNSPHSFPPQSPYHSEYSNSPQFSPAFSEPPPSPWVGSDTSEMDSTSGQSTYNQRSSEKMKADESLGDKATISAVLYANVKHHEWKSEYPNWTDRYKQILKKWRTLSQDQKAPFLQQARDNRSQQRMKKTQQSQSSKETGTPPVASPVAVAAAAAKQQPPPPPPPTISTVLAAATQLQSSVSEVCTTQKPSPTLTTASTSSVSVRSPPNNKITSPLTITIKSSVSPPTHQQFTVHGNFAGPGDHVGPAPNVTVNPNYHPPPVAAVTDQPPPASPSLLSAAATQASDQQIRVLTPSEIMRTLPSLCQENYEPTPPDQEKIVSQQKTAREAEQERQWKQLQALRQQQAQQQQNVIHEQRVQAIARVQRHIVDPTQQGMFPEPPSPIQGNTPQELSPAASPSPRQFLNINQMKSPTFVMPPGAVRAPTPQNIDFQAPPTPDIDPYVQQPGTPKPGFQPRMAMDPYVQQPSTPRPQFAAPRPQLQGYSNAPRPEPDINRQLRDLLQRQQFKKLDEQLLPGKTQQRIWPPQENQEGSDTPVANMATGDQTFRQPLPPSIARPKGPGPLQNVVRGGIVGMRMPQLDPRMQGTDNRMRLLLQQQQQQRLLNPNALPMQQPQQQFLPNAVPRFPSRPVSVEQFEQAQQLHAAQVPDSPRTLQPPAPLVSPMDTRNNPVVVPNRAPPAAAEATSTEQEIPDNVTAEIEKLEQESGTMTEFTSVGDILGLDDDDMLLDEMGADFNILEYADPELETFAGDKANILLDLELDEDTDKKEKVKATGPAVPPRPQVKAAKGKAPTPTVPPPQPQPPLTNIQQPPQTPQVPPQQQQQPPPPLGAPQQPQQQIIQQQVPQPPSIQVPGLPPASLHHLTPQQIQQQMMHQVQQAANQGRPMPPGSRLQTPDGIIGIVKDNNTVHLQVPHNYQQRLLMQQLQNQKLQMRVTQKPGPRMVAVNQAGQQVVHHPMGIPSTPAPRMPVNAPPPPPPYPGPPPPYPGNATPQQQVQTGLRMGHDFAMAGGHGLPPGLPPMMPPSLLHPDRRPLLLQEQPLLLEELLEQEKREQEKQQQQQTSHQEVTSSTGAVDSSESLLSDQDFERLKADVFSGMQTAPAQPQPPQWQPQQQSAPQIAAPVEPAPSRVFNANLLPAPPLPPENIVTEQDKQTQLVYEHWLNHQNNVLTQQLKYYETEVQKLRKIRKSLNSKQRQLKKSGNQLPEPDAAELQRVSSEQAVLQKQLESTRKQNRQHGMLIQEYRNKQQAKQNPGPGQSPLQQIQSPLGPPASSPIHHPSASQSPMMSPSASPMTQHNSPMNSPRPLVSQSPGLGAVQNIMQSPGGLQGASGMSPMQSSPRIGTPHSQGDGSPAPSPSPSQVCLPPPGPRMTSPHRRLVTSPVGYTDLRQGNPNPSRFRNPIDMAALQQRMRMQNFSQNNLNMQQKPGTPSPLNSPPPGQQLNLTQQQLIQNKLLQQQQQQQQQVNMGDNNGSNDMMQRAQLLQRQNLLRQQQQQQQMSQQQQQAVGQPQPLTPQQHQNMLHQQKLLQQQQLAQIQARIQQQQQQLQQQQLNNPPQSPLSMPPKSPMINQQIMSPHSMPASPMPPQSPMSVRSPAFSQNVGQPPSSPMRSSPMPRSPMMNQTQSPMSMRSPAMPERPTSVENPGTPRTPYNPQNMDRMQDNSNPPSGENGGGGNPRNPVIPFPFKLGLFGGSPMWGGFGRGAKRVPTPPVTSTNVGASASKPVVTTNSVETAPVGTQAPAKPKKEPHYTKVSILKKKSGPIKANRQNFVANKVGSLVSSDYNEFDDSSCTPPVTPPPSSSTSNRNVQKTIIQKKISEETKEKTQQQKERMMILHSPEPKTIHDIIDYDDDNNTVLSGEVSLSSVAQQNDGDDIEIETLSQNDLTEDLSSPLEADQITDEYLLFPGNMVVEEEVDDYASENMHFVIRSPTTSDDEYIMQGKTKKYNIVGINDTPESPEQEEMNIDPSPEPNEDEVPSFEENEVEESISTKEDFEELIDEGSRKDKLKIDSNATAKHINEFHKYAATTVYSFPPKPSGSQQTTTARIPNSKPIQKISLIPSPLVPKNEAPHKEIIIAPNAKIINNSQPTTKVTSIILTPHPVRSNVTKIVSAGGQPITIVGANSKSKFTVPIISASAVRQLSNIKVIDKSISLTTHDSSLPKKIFEDDSVSPDSSNCEEDVKSKDSSDEKFKDSPSSDEVKPPVFAKNESFKVIKTAKPENVVVINKPQPQENKQTEKKEEVASKPKALEKKEVHPVHKLENVKITNIMTKQRVPSPIIAKSSSPVIIRSTPELKMTAQVFQETSQNRIQINTDTDNSTDDTKSVVISIPSPTPSQEQMLDDIAMRAYETRRHGTAIPGTFDSFEDVLDMFENITAEPGQPQPTQSNLETTEKKTTEKKPVVANNVGPPKPAITTQQQITVTTTSTKSSVVPQLSPLSQPTELTTNMATASQQLRNLLSLQTTTAPSPTNVETLVKAQQKIVVTTTSNTPAVVVVTQQHQQQSVVSTVTSVNTVLVSNVKQQPISTKNNTVKTQFTTNVVTSSTTPTFTALNRSVGGIQLMPDHPKLPPVTMVNQQAAQNTVVVNQQTPPNATVTTTNAVVVQRTPPVQSTSSTTPTASAPSNGEQRKPSLTLTAMLQNQPAATPTTKTTPDSITAASLLATPVTIARGFNTALVQAQPNVSVSSIVATSNINNVTTSESVTSFRPVTSTTNLLHTQLTKVRTKSVDEVKEIKLEPKVEEPSPIPPLKVEEKNNILQSIKTESPTSKFSFLSSPMLNKTEDSQNVLLKKLLQNTACASTQSPTPPTTTSPSSQPPQNTTNVATEETTTPTKAIATPTLSSLLPPASIKTEAPTTPVITAPVEQQQVPKPTPQRMPIRETSFVSNPVIQQLQVSTAQPTLPPQLSRMPSRDDLLSPRSTCSQDSSLQTPPLIAKKEQLPYFSHQMMMNQQEVKKELMDESSQHSEVSDHSRPDVHMKEEIEVMDHEKLMAEKEELKKQKRRMYQKNRRQNQILKDAANGQPKKRPRKNSKFDEDYDSFIDGVLGQLRTLPPMNVSEPLLNRNYGVVSIFGAGDMSKLGTKEYDSRYGDLMGSYGNAVVPNFTDFYNTKPHGDEDPLPEKPPASTQRGFYDQEFPLIRFDCEEDRRFDAFCREDSPDSIISSSSPETTSFEPPNKFMGLKLISDDESDDEDTEKGRLSPVVPIISPIPIRLKPSGGYLEDLKEDNKENILLSSKSKFVATNQAAKDNANVTVTLTLTSSAAEDIMGVLRDLANILHIPAPTSYQIVERTNSPPSQKLGLYRTKGKDGKEGAPIDIQSILNGQAKFCKHCDVVILNNMIKRKVSDLPFLAKDSELLSEGEELYFCSIACYTQFALMHRSPSISEDKAAAAIIDHLSQDKLSLVKKNLDTLDTKVMAGKMEVNSLVTKKDEPMDCDYNSLFVKPGDQLRIRSESSSSPTVKKHKNVRYKLWSPGCLQPAQRHKKPTDKETMELLYRLGVTVTPSKMPEDFRKCIFCQGIGDSVADGPGRLLNFDVDKWVHLNCGLWSDGVYETVNGALMNLENALHLSMTTSCIHCSKMGATIRCFKNRCTSVYHLSCAVKDNCVFYKNKTVYCTVHVPKNEKDNELTTLSVSRRVYVNRDENKQVAAVMHHSETNNLLRVGSLIFLSIGQILPHQLQNFHSPNYIYPIGYKIIRFFWSMRQANKRCRYVCSIHDVNGKPEFRVLIQEQNEEDIELKESSPKAVWIKILDQIAKMRKDNQCLQIFPKFCTGEDLFGLTEPAVVRVLESLPGIETLNDYKFKYGRNPLLELPLAINPSGAARTEPKLKNQQHWKRPHTQRTCGATTRPMFGPTPPPGPSVASSFGEAACPYSKQFVHSKSSQYKKMKQEWRNNVYLARSKIQGLGLYAARDLEKHTMVIEYIGEIIRSELAESREKQYEAKNRGIYMFRLDEERVVDATLSGGLARYINHSCNPNCVAEQVEVDRDVRIIIFAKRRIQRGEELAYDYKFEFEDDQHKISCMCGAPNCRKWMN